MDYPREDELKAKIYEAVGNIQDTEVSEEVIRQLEGLHDPVPDSEDLNKEIYDALKGIDESK